MPSASAVGDVNNAVGPAGCDLGGLSGAALLLALPPKRKNDGVDDRNDLTLDANENVARLGVSMGALMRSLSSVMLLLIAASTSNDVRSW